MKETKQSSNAGFSLLELVIAVTILTVIGVGLTSFINTCMVQYRKSSSDVNVQYESQLTQNQIQEILLDANAGVTWTGGNTLNIYSYRTETDSYAIAEKTKIQITYTSSALTYKRIVEDVAAGAAPDVKATEEFVNCVAGFAVKFLDSEGNIVTPDNTVQSVSHVTIEFRYSIRERTYRSTNTVTLRNPIITSTDEANIYKAAEEDALETIVPPTP